MEEEEPKKKKKKPTDIILKKSKTKYWAEFISERFEVHRKGNNVMNGKFAGPPSMKDDFRAAI